ncbi:hypothetical protein TI39_contig4278g00008 [Zymoseptoria brevis]|uniref:Uncharacterized protein n=1 Tax=Zymoseptoria brevis TaxID=1047168 RepID=A0A0F4G9G4_9PEZI|nr:hypothetical protein TI39_contig4278g00008 [Zymoseptoria brevis]
MSDARKEIGDHVRVSTGIRARDDLTYSGTMYAKRGDTLQIWQMDMNKDSKDEYVFPVVKRLTYKYPEFFLEPRTEAEADVRTMVHPYANDTLMASMGIREPATIPCPASHKRKALLRWLVEGEFGRMKFEKSLHHPREPEWKEKVDHGAPHVLAWVKERQRAEKATKQGTTKRKRVIELKLGNTREMLVEHRDKNVPSIPAYANLTPKALYLYDIAAPGEALKLRKTKKERPNLAVFALARWKEKLEGWGGWRDEDTPEPYWLGWTWRDQEFEVDDDDKMRSMLKWCEEDMMEAELKMHVGEADATTAAIRGATWPADPVFVEVVSAV